MKDLNKKIANISYNSLHLPQQLTINGVTHKYTYVADERNTIIQNETIYIYNNRFPNASLPAEISRRTSVYYSH
ncbi:hypothetical protein HMPREF9447_01907 [Bacteroides oleiciplenus YIT 12058]|uniref:Uncharacterized protein n=1 Tax=Bacteroides oleiciplenus YIT 12058 TaxID=742727 RepID=K9DZT8_9BACE|nr:hypothetical protein HMPREF9447_01907 [Bacteroides oleiciplenus YIT 12058]